MLRAWHHRVFMFGIELKLQVECSEQWVSDAWERFLMLLCDIASLIRLSITIQFAGTLITLGNLVNRHQESTCEAGL
jgi:hypothetical protein